MSYELEAGIEFEKVKMSESYRYMAQETTE